MKSTNNDRIRRLVGRSHGQLSSIRSRLASAIFPLSCLPENKNRQNAIAHAIQAIGLAQCSLRDLED